MNLNKALVASTAILISLASCMPPAGGDAKGGSSMNGLTSLIFPLLILVVFWVFFIRPQSKRAKEQKKFVDNIGKGDKIVTTSGIHATINKVNEDGTINVEVSPGSYIKMERAAISMEMTAALNKPATAEKK
ncbi:MAG: preprotein translocase subunit YajC [Bacteroidota bacterium]|jgi:preprotein translocase subunit YajC